MGYTTYEFYDNEYGGSSIPEEEFLKLSNKASRLVDCYTSRRLVIAYPKEPQNDFAIQQCICELAELQQEIQAAKQATTIKDGKMDLIKSISSGSESITYATTESQYVKAAMDDSIKIQMEQTIINSNLAGVTDANGINLLYRGL